MPAGTLEVLLVSAKGLENTDFLFGNAQNQRSIQGQALLCNMDPYAILNCRTQEQKSSVASGKGSSPEWNENFVFTISEGVSEITIKLLDSDAGTEDDFVGLVTIPLDPIFLGGNVPPTAYNVVKDDKYCGEIRVGLVFKPEENDEYQSRGYGGSREEESYGGWRESS